MCHEIFFNYVVGNDWSIKHIPYQKKHKTLPVVLNKKEIESLLSAIKNPKYHAIAATLYGAGLRLTECLSLQIKDIDSENMVITVRQGKGKKDRQTILSEELLQILRSYYSQTKVKPVSFLFPQKKDLHHPFSGHQTQTFIKKAGIEAGITKPVSPHVLSYANLLSFLTFPPKVLSTKYLTKQRLA